MSGSPSVSINSLPTVYTVGGGGAYCAGGSGVSITLSGSQTGTNYQLKLGSSDSGTAVPGTNGALTWTSITSAGTYTITASNGNCSNTMSGSAPVTVNALPQDYLMTGGGVYCPGGSGLTVGITGSRASDDYQLRLNGSPIGSAVAGTTGPMIWSNLTGVGTYTVRATTRTTSCALTLSDNKTISTYAPLTAYNVTNGGAYCPGSSGSSVWLSSSDVGVTYYLYLNGANTGTTLPGTGGTLKFNGLTTVGTYSMVGVNTTTNCSLPMNGSVSVSVHPTLGAPSAVNTAICGTGTMTATAGTNATTVRWYDVSTGGTALQTNTTSPSTSATKTYFLTSYNQTNLCESTGARLQVTLTVNAIPSAPTGSSTAICGSGTMTATPGASANAIRWYLSSTGGSPQGTASVTSPTTSATTPYWITSYNTTTLCESTAARLPVTLTVNPVPNAPIASNTSYCGSGSLTPTIGTYGNTIRWYSALSGGTTFPTSPTSPVTTATTTYYITTFNDVTNCESTAARLPVTLTINAIPAAPTGSSTTICGSGTMTATPGASANAIRWYLSSSGGSPQATSGITSPLTSATTPYWITSFNNLTNCESTDPRLPVTLTVDPIPAITVAGSTSLVYGNATQLSTGPSYAYQWKNNGVALAGETAQQLAQPIKGSITVGVKASASSPECVSPAVVLTDPLSGSAKTNYVSVTRIRKAGVNASTPLYSLTGFDLSQTIMYQDAMGRTFQTVGVGQTPQQGDLVIQSAPGPGLADSTFLPFAASSKSGALRLNAIRGANGTYQSSDQYTFYQTASGVPHDANPYATTKYRAAPDRRVVEQGAPGADWQPGQHSVENVQTLNTASYPVRKWTGTGTTAGNYPSNSISVSITTDENENKVQIYTNVLGRVVLKRVQADETFEGVVTAWLDTYYAYDDFGRLTYQIPPKALKVLGNGASLNANNASVAELIFKYTYDTRGRVTQKKVPGAGLMYYVYDKLDRVVLTQDARQRVTGKWTFYKYDSYGRMVYSGLYVNAGTLATVAALVPTTATVANSYESEQVNATTHGYSNNVFPTTSITVLSVNYYDHYDFDRNGTPDFTYDNAHVSGQEQAAGSKTRGLPTGSKQVLIDATGITSNWLIGAAFYDQYDRPIQTQSNNALYLAGIDKQTTVYDFAKPLKTYSTHNKTASSSLSILDRADFDHAGRVTKVYRKIGNDPEQTVAEYSYNSLGQVIAKKLHKKADNSFVQTVDYTYNIRGWLKKINDPGSLGSDFFAQELVYNENLNALGQSGAWNGNITATTWKEGFGNSVTDQQKAYAYTYAKNDQLKNSKYGAGASFALNVDRFNEQNITYDVNGNIKGLQRVSANAAGINTTIDNLTYTYQTNRNSIGQVEDGAANTAGFNNGASTGTEMLYDGAGDLTKDDNKGISAISYNALGKVERVTLAGNKELRYTYDASGNKVAMEEWTGATLTRTTRYVGGFVYENDTLRFFSSPEGRVVVNNGTNYEYQYALADHQGNTRTVFTSKVDSLSFTATFETPASGLRQDTDLFDNVLTSNEVTIVGANSTPGGAQSYKMNQSTPAGPGIMLRVYPGDQVKAQVSAYFESANGYTNNNQTLAAMITAVAGSFGGVQNAGGESGGIYDMFNEAISAFGLGPNQSDSHPAAYLNYFLFDEQSGFDLVNQADNAGWKAVPASALGVKQVVKLDSVIKIKKPGYVYIYLSYENQSDNYVYFDDFKVTYTKGPVVQNTNYYPFGLQTADSWTRIDAKPNQYLYNAGSELNNLTGTYETFFRGYDPSIGRMSGVDIMADKYSSLSPYNYAFNDPVFFNDPSGADAAPLYSEATRYLYGESAAGGVFRPRIMDTGVFGNAPTIGAPLLINPGFTNARTWGLLFNAWNSVGNNQTGHWQLFNGQVISGGVIDNIQQRIVSWVGSAPSDYNTAGSIVIDGIVSAIAKKGGLAKTALSGVSPGDILSLLAKEAGITTNDIFGNATILENVDIDDTRIDGSEWNSWLNAAQGVVGSFALGTHAALNGSRPMYTGPGDWARQLAAGEKFAGVLKWGGRALGVTAFIGSAADLYNNPNPTASDYIKVGANFGLIFASSNAVGFAISVGWTAIEASGGVDWAVDGVSAWFEGSKGPK
jgi:RHS repeat-associated protein